MNDGIKFWYPSNFGIRQILVSIKFWYPSNFGIRKNVAYKALFPRTKVIRIVLVGVGLCVRTVRK
jgi:hypothetical protein